MSGTDSRLSRRSFLLVAGAGGAAAVATVAVKQAVQVPPATTGSGKRATRGYVATEHIKTYYRTTRV